MTHHSFAASPALRRVSLALVTWAFMAAAAAQSVDVSGVKIDESARVAGKELRLNGAGVRTRAVFKVYAMGLYLGKKETTVDAILASPGPRRFHLVMMRDVSADDFGQAFMAGINNNTDKAEKGKIVNQMVKFGEMFVNVGQLKKGDTLQTDWIPDRGTVITLNGKPIIEPLPDIAFYNALLKIWLGDKPADAALKTALMGGS